MKKLIRLSLILILTAIIIITTAGCFGDDGNGGDIESNIAEEDLYGDWTATSETINGEPTKAEDMKNYTITFNDDGTYSSVSKDLENEGLWEIDADTIVFKDADSGETEIEGDATLDGDTLTLEYFVFVKIVVVYKRD